MSFENNPRDEEPIDREQWEKAEREWLEARDGDGNLIPPGLTLRAMESQAGREILLNKSGQRAGSTGELLQVWTLGSFDPKNRYLIEVDTLSPTEVVADPEEHPEVAELGRMRLPVRSVAKIGRVFFFATDLRFLAYPGAECVFPVSRKLSLRITQGAGSVKAALMFGEHPVIESKSRKHVADSIEELARWAERQGDRFEFPAEVVEAIKTLDSDRKPSIPSVTDQFETVIEGGP